MAAAFHLPHNAAANWMSNPQALAVAHYPGECLQGCVAPGNAVQLVRSMAYQGSCGRNCTMSMGS